jgi:acetyltransferase (GNAT) family protein
LVVTSTAALLAAPQTNLAGATGWRGAHRESADVIVNMIVDLQGVSFETPDEPINLAAAGVNLVNREGASPDDYDWIRKTFGGKWPDESAASWNWFARGSLGTTGFSAYGQHSIRWWWLEQWWDRKDVGIFGPMGVHPSLRGMHVGVALARRALGSLQAMGYAYALIPSAGPTEFYERYCGAKIVERLKRRL